MESMAAVNSAFREVFIPILRAKAPKKEALAFLKIPPQAEIPGLPTDAPSQLHLIQFKIGGCQRTSLILGALPKFLLTWNFWRSTNSEILE
ncbi:hypothetical protein P8452_58489 [Trifolium repens]|nr:hypothetical protein P8452_58489 [Trifolium repens]